MPSSRRGWPLSAYIPHRLGPRFWHSHQELLLLILSDQELVITPYCGLKWTLTMGFQGIYLSVSIGPVSKMLLIL